MESTKVITNIPLTINIYNADENSFHVTSTIVSGETECILIDAQFTLSDAHKVVAEILSSKKKLKAVYISYVDPDFYFGLEVVRQAFPDVPILATPETITKIKASYEKKLSIWGPKLGSNGTKNVIIPDALEADFLELEGHKLEIVGLDNKERAFIYIPSIKTVIASINVFGNLHL